MEKYHLASEISHVNAESPILFRVLLQLLELEKNIHINKRNFIAVSFSDMSLKYKDLRNNQTKMILIA